MADNDNRVLRASRVTDAGLYDAGLRSHMLRVYNYMMIGLVLTGLTAYATANTQLGQLFYHTDVVSGRQVLTVLGMSAFVGWFLLGFVFIFGIQRMSVATAQMTFWIYASLFGVATAPILWVYTEASVAETFFITAATFGAMSLWGYTTRSNLTGMGSFLFMGLIGLMIAMVVNIFLRSSEMQWIISVAGVLIFTGLTAYDTQKIKEMYVANDDGTVAGRKAIYGAFQLYLDFVNMFLFLLRLIGDRR